MLKFYKLFFAILIFSFTLFSCSLKYDEITNANDISPELQFTKVDYKKYENKKLETQIKADILERYRSDDSAYAKNVEFYSWNAKSELLTKGSCALLAIDSNNEIYTLFNNIFLHNIDQNFQLKGTNLKWNGKTEQLTSGINDTIYIIKDDIEIEGTGFSASGISKSFSFENSVSGTITSSENNDNEIEKENQNE